MATMTDKDSTEHRPLKRYARYPWDEYIKKCLENPELVIEVDPQVEFGARVDSFRGRAYQVAIERGLEITTNIDSDRPHIVRFAFYKLPGAMNVTVVGDS